MLSWPNFIKKLIALDALWGSRSKKLAGINDKDKVSTVDVTIDGGTGTITFVSGDRPIWLNTDKYFRIADGVNAGSLFQVASVGVDFVTVVEPITTDSGTRTLDGRMWVVHNDNTITRKGPDGGTMFRLDNMDTTGRPDGSGIAKVYAVHYHANEPWRLNIRPDGAQDNQNLIFYLPNGETFVEGSLEVYLSCLHLNGNQTDTERDLLYLPDNSGFIIVLDPEDRWRLNRPPLQDEPLLINYLLDLP